MILYSTDCPKCKILKNEMDKLELEYKIAKDVDEMSKLGIMAVPVLSLDGELLEFKDALGAVRKMGN